MSLHHTPGTEEPRLWRSLPSVWTGGRIPRVGAGPSAHPLDPRLTSVYSGTLSGLYFLLLCLLSYIPNTDPRG